MIHSKFYCSGCDDSWIEHEKAEDPGLCPNCYSSDKTQEVEFREAKGWVRVEDGNPKHWKLYNVVIIDPIQSQQAPNSRYSTYGFISKDGVWTCYSTLASEFLKVGFSYLDGARVTHYCPLPEPPEGDA